MITLRHKGDFKNTEKFFNAVKKDQYLNVLHKYGNIGVSALEGVTPRKTGKTASSWSYKVSKSKNSWFIGWYNSNIVDGVAIAIIIQYGHATRSGTFIQGQDYINPAMKSVFDKIADDVWEEVKKL